MGKKSELKGFGYLDEDIVSALIDNPYECPIVIDNKGIIRFMSRFSKSLIKIDPENAIGRHISDVIPETRLHEVLEEGKARIGDTLYIAGRQQVISRIPLRNLNDEIIGAVGKGIFNETSKVLDLHRRIEQLNGKILALQEQVSIMKGGAEIVGQSELIRATKENAFQAARTNASVLITGETGTGKEVIAYYIHMCSQRAKEPFIRVNCAAIPSDLFESELFGYEEGAFSGARAKGKPGKFELAKGGTIFLDEIAELPISLQAKLLRVIQEKTVDRLGGTKPIDVDFRLIAATNRNLQNMVKKELFRMDLYFRINVFQIQAPSLRQIREDIPIISRHLLSLLKEEIGWGPSSISDDAIETLKQYAWPGNVRELRNVLERVMIVSKDNVIHVENLAVMIKNNGIVNTMQSVVSPEGTLRQILEAAEKKMILETLHHTKGNKLKAAKVLGIHRSSLYEKLKRMGAESDEYGAHVKED
ncbi:MAG: sigma 54-interacting transcriptional regulator [Desulfatirhabdiaceae bacterium]|nr:sigma 54-interacting transcriptional regulator [Desulfatirhabdiaceae bacterium]